MVDLQIVSVAVGIVVGVVTLIIGVLDSVLSNRSSRKTGETTLETRQAQFFMQIYGSFHEVEFFDKFTNILTWRWEDYDDFMGKYGWRANPEAWHSFGAVSAFFEGIGVLVHRGLIDIRLVGELMSRHIVMYWEKIGPVSMEMRRRLELPVDWYLEYLYDEMRPILEKQKLEILKRNSGPGPA